MTRSLPQRRIPRLLFALLMLGGGLAAGPAGAAGWQAVLVAGDNAQPVFDNAVAAMTQILVAGGVPIADIHRLTASRAPRDITIEPATAERVLQRIAGLRPRPGERCLVFITSHGQRGQGAWLAELGEHLRPAALAQALSAGCGAAPTVVIVSSCYSGAFAGGPMRAPNRIILTAARADRPSFGCQADRTYTVFDECLLSTIQSAPTWRVAFDYNSACVRQHEKQLNVQPSQPQGVFGATVRDLPIR
jgi:hypothetical protein